MTNHIAAPEEHWRPLENIDRHCFGCGPDNSHGLQMRFATNGRMIRSQVVMAERFRGWSNLIHGGVLSTLLDEVMGWTVIILSGKFMLTKTMRVTFKRPVRIGARLTVTGYIKERIGERRAVVAAEIREAENDALCATAEGEFALFSREQFERMAILPEEDLAAMAAVIS